MITLPVTRQVAREEMITEMSLATQYFEKLAISWADGSRMTYRIRGIIDESNVWRFTLKNVIELAVLSTVWKETHAYNLNGVHLIWQYLRDSPNCQIKYTMCTV